MPDGTADLYIAILGVLTVGAAYVPVDHSDPDDRAEGIWRDVDVAAVVGERLEITVRHRGLGRAGAPGEDDDCWVIFTSGSTGTPKAVVVHHRAAAAFVDAETKLLRIRPEDRVLAGLSVGFDASCEEMWLAWRNGAALVPAARALVQTGADLGPWFVERGITVVSTVPTLAAMWNERDLRTVRLLVLGGEVCPEQLGWRLAGRREVWNTYGPTEATVVTTAQRIRPGRPVTIGWPIPGWNVAVVDETGEPVGFGETGELVIGGAGLGRYLDEELDRARYEGVAAIGWDRAYRTGDRVRATADGIEFVGRRDDQIKIGGRRIELGEIDAQLCAVPGVRAAATAVRHTNAGNEILVGYVVGDVDATEVRDDVAERLPSGMVPRVVVVDALVHKPSGKVDREALPWPLASTGDLDSRVVATVGKDDEFDDTTAWLAACWADQLGIASIDADRDFFELGGSSLAAARLVSVLRGRFPSVAVADVYNHRTLRELADRLDRLGAVPPKAASIQVRRHRWVAIQLVGVLVLTAIGALQWLLGLFAYNQWIGGAGLPKLGWVAIVAGWLAVSSAPGRSLLLAASRWLLLRRMVPGRYPRQGWLACRVWFVERFADVLGIQALAGTPWAARCARWFGAEVGGGARLASVPSPTALVRVGDGATIEADVDLHGWWVEDRELIVGEIVIGAHARVGTRCLLMPGSEVGAGAEIEPGSVVNGSVPAGERWSGSPARRVGQAGEAWPAVPPLVSRSTLGWKLMYALGLGSQSLLPLAAALPSLLVLRSLGAFSGSFQSSMVEVMVAAPLLAIGYLVAYALLAALAYRAVARLVRPGWHRDDGATAWALWFGESLLAGARVVMFPLYSSVYTRRWLRMLGIEVGKRTEVSTAVGLNPLVRLGDASFVADDVVFAGSRARDGWIEVTSIEVGDRTFLGNGAILRAGTTVGDDALVGVLSTPPAVAPDGTSWLGQPALELPRVAQSWDPARTLTPPPRLVAGRGAMDALRIVGPSTVSVVLGALVLLAMARTGTAAGAWILLGVAPFLVFAAGLVAAAVTIAVKWLAMGRYRSEEHPLWSFFVWRDELVNACQEQLAGPWLLDTALGTPVMPLYLRAMGATIGRDVWFETLAVTEFDLVRVGDGCGVNRGACVETHLFHDRVMRTGPALLDRESTLGPHSAVLPDTSLGVGCSVGARSVVMRGEQLPARTRWHGAPVKAL